jgi:hypothetical protein
MKILKKGIYDVEDLTIKISFENDLINIIQQILFNKYYSIIINFYYRVIIIFLMLIYNVQQERF